MNVLSVLVRLGLLAMTMLLMVIMTVSFDERLSSIKSTRYGRVVKPVHREGTILYSLLLYFRM